MGSYDFPSHFLADLCKLLKLRSGLLLILVFHLFASVNDCLCNHVLTGNRNYPKDTPVRKCDLRN
jgi:hypothetical protein